MSKPLHTTVADKIIELIRSDSYAAGDRLPTEPVLAKTLGVSRAILREGLNQLEASGYIYRLHGLGTFIKTKYPGINLNLSIPRSITAMLDSLGFVPGVRSMKMTPETVFPDDVDRLEVPADSKVYRIERIRTANGQPVAWTTDVVPAWVMKKHPSYEGKSNFSLFMHLATHCGVVLAPGTTTLMPLHNVQSVAEKLEIDPSSHIFFFEGVDRAMDGNPVVFSREYFAPWIFRFNVTRTP
jgi:GntR family transcriptional regulator